MEYTRIVAVTGMPGLFEVISSKADGAIVRSLEDKSTKFVSSRIHNLSHLESIEVYTVRENVTLSDVFTSMKESGSALPDTKDNKALRSYFENVFPDLDFERVYPSDMKKMVKWFEVLNQNEVDFTAQPREEEEGEASESAAGTAVAEAPAKPKAKAKAPKAEEKEEEDEDEEEVKAPKKTAAKTAASKTAAAKKTASKSAPAKTASKKSASAEKPAAKKAAPKKKKD